MIDKQEMLLFMKELGHLLNDHKECEEVSLKQEIHKDILLLIDAIYLGRNDDSGENRIC